MRAAMQCVMFAGMLAVAAAAASKLGPGAPDECRDVPEVIGYDDNVYTCAQLGAAHACNHPDDHIRMKVRLACKKTCGVCASNKCAAEPLEMPEDLPVPANDGGMSLAATQACPAPGDEDYAACCDRQLFCGYWKSMGYCNRGHPFAAYILPNCAATCKYGICTGGIADPDHEAFCVDDVPYAFGSNDRIEWEFMNGDSLGKRLKSEMVRASTPSPIATCRPRTWGALPVFVTFPDYNWYNDEAHVAYSQYTFPGHYAPGQPAAIFGGGQTFYHRDPSRDWLDTVQTAQEACRKLNEKVQVRKGYETTNACLGVTCSFKSITDKTTLKECWLSKSGVDKKRRSRNRMAFFFKEVEAGLDLPAGGAAATSTTTTTTLQIESGNSNDHAPKSKAQTMKGNGTPLSCNTKNLVDRDTKNIGVRCCKAAQAKTGKCPKSYSEAKRLAGDPAICGKSLCKTKRTFQPMTFSEAEDYCASDGGRLCTAAETVAKEAAKTGCSLDLAQVWVADTCVDVIE